MQKDLERRLVFTLFYAGAAIALLFAAQVFADDETPPAGQLNAFSLGKLGIGR